MRKIFLYLITFTAICLLILSTNVKSVSADQLKMSFNDKSVKFTYGTPFIQDNRSLFPLRDLLITLGVPNDTSHIQWDNAKQTVRAIKDDVAITLTVGEKTLYRNGEAFYTLDVPAMNVNGRIYLPARAVAEAFGYKIGYHSASGVVTVTGDGTEEVKPSVTSDGGHKALKEDVAKFVQDTRGMKLEQYSKNQASTLSNIKNMDQLEVSRQLIGAYDNNAPNSNSNRAIITFIDDIYSGMVPSLVQYAIKHADSDAVGYKVNQILSKLSVDKGTVNLGKILTSHTNENVRYNAAYILSQIGSDDAFNILLKQLKVEKSEMVIGNSSAAVVKLANERFELINQVFDVYVSMNTTSREQLLSAAYSYLQSPSIQAAWSKVLAGKKDTGTTAEQEAVNEFVEYYHIEL